MRYKSENADVVDDYIDWCDDYELEIGDPYSLGEYSDTFDVQGEDTDALRRFIDETPALPR